jgi:hypothetical protein
LKGDLARALKRGGKPKLPPELKRSEWINFRVTIAEADAIYRAVYHAGLHMGVGDYLLACAGLRETDCPISFPIASEGATVRQR